MKKSYFTVTGMSCAACSASVERAVSGIDGVVSAAVNLTTGKLTVYYDDNKLSVKDIENAVTKSGFGVNHDSFEDNLSKRTAEVKDMKKKFIISAVFAIPLFYISMGYMLGMPLFKLMSPQSHPLIYAFCQMLLSLGCVCAGYKFYTKGFRNLFSLRPNMDTLVAVGTSSAFIYGVWLMADMYINHNLHNVHNLYFESVGVVITLIQLGKYLENRSKLKTNDAIVKLIELTPKQAVIIKNGEKITVDVKDILPGDVVAVLPGDKIPVDGIVINGTSSVDESMLTGESIPAEKSKDSKVFAGCLNKGGYLEVISTSASEESVISRIISMVEEASGSKPQLAHLADKICGVFVPCVICAAFVAGIVWLLIGAGFSVAIDRFISVLVVACPCALGLATPTAVIVSVGRAATEGILVKDAHAMEQLSMVDTFVFDKTGTLTKGEPEVTHIHICEGFKKDTILEYAYAVESISEHPLSDAVCNYAKNNGVKETPGAANFKSVSGKGIKAIVDSKEILIGNKKFLDENKVPIIYDEIDILCKGGNTVMYMAVDGVFAAVFAARDTLKPDAQIAVNKLNSMGKKTLLLTGDNKIVADIIAKEVGIDCVVAEVLPQDKAESIKALMAKGSKVAMIGDGINDSVALTVADVGISVGSGTEIALEAADIVVMKDELNDIVKAVQISKLAIKNIKQNLFYAFIYNTLLIPVAAGALTFINITFNPMIAATAMALSSVSVVINALRLKRIKITN